MNQLSKDGVTQIILWAAAAPIIGTWALVSFIPVSGLFDPESLVDLFVEILFLATGFAGLFGVLVFAAFTKEASTDASVLRPSGNKRAITLSAWAIAWMTAYAFYSLA